MLSVPDKKGRQWWYMLTVYLFIKFVKVLSKFFFWRERKRKKINSKQTAERKTRPRSSRVANRILCSQLIQYEILEKLVTCILHGLTSFGEGLWRCFCKGTFWTSLSSLSSPVFSLLFYFYFAVLITITPTLYLFHCFKFNLFNFFLSFLCISACTAMSR